MILTRMPEVDPSLFSFHIDHIDPLGQGVDKNQHGIHFIAKTLPLESGTARRLKSKKGVHFAKLIQLEEKSTRRILPDCAHFEVCPGCDYLHTDYDTELNFKRDSLIKSLQHIDFDHKNIEILKANRRLGYRNRLQLHYRHGKLGLVDGLSNEIVEIPECKMLDEVSRPVFDSLYNDLDLKKRYKGQGHVELYHRAGSVHLSWDKPYADGGFSQVNAEMNTVLRRAVTASLKAGAHQTILDLFSGDGNLSEQIVEDGAVTRMRVDNIPAGGQSDFIRQDLYRDSALKRFSRKCSLNQFEVILLDPPRAGFPVLSEWITLYRPKRLLYVSCNAATLARDLGQLQQAYTIETLSLIDLFPATRHFETLTLLSFPETG